MKRVVPGFKVVWVTHLQFIVIRLKYWYILQKKKNKKFLTCPNPLKNLNLEQPTLNVEIQRKKDFHEYTNVHLSGVKTNKIWDEEDGGVQHRAVTPEGDGLWGSVFPWKQWCMQGWYQFYWDWSNIPFMQEQYNKILCYKISYD